MQNYYNLKQICFLIYFYKFECYNIKLFLESYEYYYVLYKFNIYKYDLLNISVGEIKKHIMKNEDIYCEWTNFVNDYQEYFN